MRAIFAGTLVRVRPHASMQARPNSDASLNLAGNNSTMSTHANAASEEIESAYAWLRLVAALALGTIGSIGMWSFVVALPSVQADFGVARGEASLPFTLTMIGFGIGGIVMGRLADRFGIV